MSNISGESNLKNMTESKATDLFLKTSLGEIAQELKINTEMACQLVSEDPAHAVESFSNRFGIQPLLIHAIIAIVKNDLPKTMEIVEKLSQMKGVDMDPEVA